MGANASIMLTFIKGTVELEYLKNELLAYKIGIAMEKQKLEDVQINYPIKKEFIEGLYKLFMLSKPLVSEHQHFIQFMESNGYNRGAIINFNANLQNARQLETNRKRMADEDKPAKQEDPAVDEENKDIVALIKQHRSKAPANKSASEIYFDTLFLNRLFLTEIEDRIERSVEYIKSKTSKFDPSLANYGLVDSKQIADNIYKEQFESVTSWYNTFAIIQHKLNEIEIIRESILQKGSLFSFPPIECEHDNSIYDIKDDIISYDPCSKLTEYYCSLTKISYLFSCFNVSESENNEIETLQQEVESKITQQGV